MDSRRRGRVLPLLAGVLGCCVLATTGLRAQKPGTAGPMPKATTEKADQDPAAAQSVFLPVDRSLLLLLSKARQLAQDGRYAEAVRCLGTILEAPEDYFDRPLKPGASSPVYPSLKSEAQSLLSQMPSAGRELYELQYGTRARQMLTAATTAGDPGGLAEVSRRFFHTWAGYEATLLLAFHQLDHGSPLAAALTLQRFRTACPVADQFEPGLSVATAACWLRAGQTEKAESVLQRAREQFPRSAVRIGGAEIVLSAKAGQLLGAAQVAVDRAKADEWPMFRGNAARNAAADSSGPLLSVVWRVPTAEYPYVESLIEQIQQGFRERDYWALPSCHPLVVNNTVLMRTARNLLAVDLVTGKRLWEVPGDDPFESLLDPPGDGPFQAGMARPQFDVTTAIKYRMWGDATFGCLGSDGDRVFAVEDLSLDLWNWASRMMFTPTRRSSPLDAKPHNRLAAYDIRTGKLTWHLGGSPEELGLPLAGTFFLGAPLPLAGQLYVLGETKGEIRLFALDAKSGGVSWTQQLAVVDQERDAVQDPLRRLAGASPSYADGVLACPTSNRSIVAVELATRSLLWGYVYKRANEGAGQPPGMFFGPGGPMMDPDPAGRWANSPVILAEGKAVVTPGDSDEIHCLNLIDGKLLWHRPRADDLYAACVYQGKVVLAGRRAVRALRLADGEPAWDGRVVELPAGGSPTGSGFLGGDRYYLPVSSAEVLVMDLRAGRTVHSYKSRRGTVPGNLVCYGGMILSQRAGAVDLFHQLDALRKKVDQRLAVKPDDPEALAQRGEVLWDEGKLQEAIACFRRSLESAPGSNTRGLLREVIFEGLRTEFPAYRSYSEEARRLTDDVRQEATYLRLMAGGLESVREFRPAWDTYLKLIDLDRRRRDLEPMEKVYSLRRDRWIQVQLAALRQAAPAEVRAEIDKEVQARFDAAVRADTPEAFQQFLDYFAPQPPAQQARARWAAKLLKGQRLLQAETVLRSIERSGDRPRAGAAVAELAAMLRQAELPRDAARVYARLEREFGDVVCGDGKTGRQLVEALPADDPVRRALEPAGAWPTAAVTVERSAQKSPPPLAFGVVTIPQVESSSPFAADLTFEIQQSPSALSARDGWGRVRWQMPMGELMRQGSFPFSAAFLRAAVRDHLLLLSMGFKVVAVDTLGTAHGGSPRVLWTQDLSEPGKVPQGRRSLRVQPIGMFGGFPPFGVNQRSYAVNAPIAIGEAIVCYQRFQSLYGVDPLTGEVVWVREDTRPDSTLFGDDRFVFVLPPDQSAATVVSTSDGKVLGNRPIPQERLTTVGRNVLVWREATLQLIDPWENRPVWPAMKFKPDSRIQVVDRDLAAVLESGERFVLVSLADGRKVIDAPVQPVRTFSDIHVLLSEDHCMLIVNGLERTGQPEVNFYGLGGMPHVQITRAHVYSFDRRGKKLWAEPVTVQDQFLLVNQPANLPVLVFACGVQKRTPNFAIQPKTAILCVDKRTGRVVSPPETYDGLSHFRIVADQEKKTIEFHLQRDVVALKFTDTPPPPPPPTKPTKTSSALWKSLWKAAAPAVPPLVWDQDGVPSLPRVVQPALPVPPGKPAAKEPKPANSDIPPKQEAKK